MELTESQTPKKVFISYSWDSEEHKEKVLNLADRLNHDGINCQIDRYVLAPPQGWTRWMHEQIEAADFVLMVFTENYQQRMEGKAAAGVGQGVIYEGTIITNLLYYDNFIKHNEKFIPIIFSPTDRQYISRLLIHFQSHDLSTEFGYEDLYRHLTNQPFIKQPEPGKTKILSERQRQPNPNP